MADNEYDIVITMLPSSEAVESVYLDDNFGILAGAKAISSCSTDSPFNKLMIECGTIETSTILSVNEATKTTASTISPPGHNLTFVDAPVSGGPMGAGSATSTFMVGADSETTMPRVQDHLRHMGKPESIFRCGEVGAGTAFKVINNYLSAITSLAASEALNIGAKMGLDVKLLNDVINVSGGQCWVTSKACPVPGVMEGVPSSRGHDGGFRLELCRKVLGMGSELAEMVGARTVLDKPTLAAFDAAAADKRYAGKGARVIYKWLNESESS